MRFLCALLVTAAALAAQTVDGTVVNSVTGAAVPDAQLQARPALIPRAPIDKSVLTIPPVRDASTDTAGHFRFEALADGDYFLICNKDGFRMGGAATFHITAGADPLHLRVSIVPDGRVSGRVIDDQRRPVSDAKLVLTNGNRESSAMTDENGAFTIERLDPGAYTLSARAPFDWDPPEPVHGQELTWALTYYPGVSFPEAAARIVVGSGAEVTDLEIKLQASPAHHIRGVVLNPRGEPSPGASVHLINVVEKVPTVSTTEAAGDGSFDLTTTDGNWRLRAEAREGEVQLEALQPVQVSKRDEEGVKLRLAPAFSIEGKVSYDPPLPPDSRKGTRITLDAPGRVTTEVSVLDPDGRFTMENIFPGTYSVHTGGGMQPVIVTRGGIFSSSQPYYLASVRVGGQDALGREIEILSGSESIEIQFQAHGGTIRGVVTDCNRGEVILQPQETWLSSFVRFAVCDPSGHFEILNIRPGSYYLAAVDRSSLGTPVFGSGRLDANLLLQAAAVTVRPDDTSTVELRLIK